MRQTVSACLIVRDEEDNLPHCISGLKGLFDEIVVLDTGSTDRTREVARDLGARVFEYAWCDNFAAARNTSRSHATGDWIFWFDADDRLDAPEADKLRKLFDRLPPSDQPAPVYVMNCRSRTPHSADTFEIAHTRLFRNKTDLRWRGRIHEYLIHDPTGKPEDHRDLCQSELAFTDIVIRHDGYDDPDVWTAKQVRDLRILTSDYLLYPDNPLTPFYIGRSLASMSRAAEAVDWFRRAIAVDPKATKSSTPKSYTLLIRCLKALGRMDEAMHAASEAVSRLSLQFELWYEAGMMFMSGRRLKEAEDCFRALAGRSIDDQRRAGLPSHMTPVAARRMLAEVLILRGAIAPAADMLRQVVADDPHQANAWLLMGELALQQGWKSDVQSALAALTSMPDARVEMHLLRAMIALQDRLFSQAINNAITATQLCPKLPGAWIMLGRSLSAEGQRWGAAADAFEQALRLNPGLSNLQQQISNARAMENQRRARTAEVGELQHVPHDIVDAAFAYQGGAA